MTQLQLATINAQRTIGKHFLLFCACLEKVYVDFKRYSVNSISQILSLYLIFATIYLGISTFAKNDIGITPSNLIVDYIQWMFCVYCYQNIAESVISTSSRGTIQKLYLNSFGYKWYLFYDSIAYFIMSCLEILAILVLIKFTIMPKDPFPLHFIKLFPLLLLSLVSIIGFGYFFGGIALIVKRINSLLYIFQYLFAILLISLRGETLVAYLAPYAYGSYLIKRLMSTGGDLSDLTLIEILIVAVNSIVYFTIGIMVFSLCEKIVLKKGSLGHF